MSDFQQRAAQLEEENKLFLKNYSDVSPEDAVSGEEFLFHMANNDLSQESLLHHADEIIRTAMEKGTVKAHHMESIIKKLEFAIDSSVVSGLIKIEPVNFSFGFEN